jgi:hypothetical protein
MRTTYPFGQVAFWMPKLASHITIYFNELLQYPTIATSAFRSESNGIMVRTIGITVMLVVRILRTEQRGTYRTGEMLDMIFFI